MQYFPPDPQPMYKEFYRFAKLGYFLHIGKDMTFSFASLFRDLKNTNCKLLRAYLLKGMPS